LDEPTLLIEPQLRKGCGSREPIRLLDGEDQGGQEAHPGQGTSKHE
jgi:hypothetical protein